MRAPSRVGSRVHDPDEEHTPAQPPTTCMTTNMGAELGAMPANVSDRVRATVTAGLAKLVELVNQ